MDPVSGLGLVALVKDVVELGFKLKGSLEKSKWNRKRLRRLADEVLSDLYALQTMYDERKDMFKGSSSHQLALAMDKLRSELWRVCNRCQTMVSANSQPRSIKAIESSFKAWNNRDLIEQEILDLRNIVRDCYLQFTTLTVARIESDMLVHRTENSLMLRRLELAGNQMLLNTEYGHGILNRIGKEIMATSDIRSVEREYFSLQVSRVSDMIPDLLRFKSDPSILTEKARCKLSREFEVVQSKTQPLDILIRSTLGLSEHFQQSDVLSSADVAFDLSNIFDGMQHMSLSQERKALGMAAVEFYHTAALHNPLLMPVWALYLGNLSSACRTLGQYQSAFSYAKNALTVFDMVQLSYPDKMTEIRPAYAWAHNRLSLSLEGLGQRDESLVAIREAVEHFEVALDIIINMKGCLAKGDSGKESTTLSESERYTVVLYFYAIDDMSRMNRDQNPGHAFGIAKKALLLTESLSSTDIPKYWTIRQLYLQAMSSLTAAYIKGDGAAHGLAEEAVTLFRRLSQVHPRHFSLHFLRVLYIYVCVPHIMTSATSNTIPLSETHAEILRMLLYDGATVNCPRMLFFFPEGSLHFDPEYIKPFGPLEGVVHDIVYAAGTTKDEDLKWINPEVAKGLSSFISSVIRTHSEEATKSLLSFKHRKPCFSLLTRVMEGPVRHLPIPFLRTVLELSSDLDLSPNSETEPSVNLLKAYLYLEAALYSHALEEFQKDPLPDYHGVTLSSIQALLGRYEESTTNFKASLERGFQALSAGGESLPVAMLLCLQQCMEALCQQRRYGYGLQLVKGYLSDFTGAIDNIRVTDFVDFTLLRAIAYLGIGNPECTTFTCEKNISCLRADLTTEWSLWTHFQLSYWLTILARALMATGNMESAFGCAEESASFYSVYNFSDERLWNWRARRCDRAYSYNTYASTLALLGEHGRALDVVKSAAAIYEEVEQDTPSCGADQASCLETLAKVHWALGKKSEAVEVQKEATGKWVKIASQLLHLGNDAALAFDTLGNYLDAEGRMDEATKAREDSVEWKARHVEDQCEPLDKSYWDLFPEDCPEGFDPLLGRMRTFGAGSGEDSDKSNAIAEVSSTNDGAQNSVSDREVEPSEILSDEATSNLAMGVSLNNGTAGDVGDGEKVQNAEVTETPSSTIEPPQSMISSAMGWFDKLVEQSAELPIDSVAVL